MLGSVQAAELYYTNRTVTSVTFNLPPDPSVELLHSEVARLTEIVRGEPIRLNSNQTYAIEREAFTVGYLAALDAWNAAVAYQGPEYEYADKGKIFDNVGWVRGTHLARGEWGAYLWTVQNRIVFYPSIANFCQATSDGVPVFIKNVIVGSLGIYPPLAYVVDIGPHLDEATNNYPGAGLSESREFYADITNVFYEVIIPEIWLRPKQAFSGVGGSNVLFLVTGTKIPQGVSWRIYPTNFAGHAGFAVTTTNSAWVAPGTVATNYKIRATSKDNTNFYDEVDLTVLKVDIVETNVYICINDTNTLHLTPDSSVNVQWEITPSVAEGAFIEGSLLGTSAVINAGALPTNYTVRATSVNNTNIYDEVNLTVVRVVIDNYATITYDGLDSFPLVCRVEPEGITPSSYAWSATWSTPAYNDPRVQFQYPPAQVTRITNAHWYSMTPPPGTTNVTAPYYIYATVQINGNSCSNATPANCGVKVYKEAGQTLAPECTGASFYYLETNGYFTITSVGVWERVNAVISNAYTQNSQFYLKAQAHEQQHKDDYDNGFDGHRFVQKTEFEPMVIGLTNSTLEGLRAMFKEELDGWYLEEEAAEMWGVRNEMEDRAYLVSDAVPPFYFYQRGGL